MRLVETKKVVREWLRFVRPFAKVEVSPRLHLRVIDAVVPGEEWNDPELVEMEWFCDYAELVAESQDLIEFLNRIQFAIADPQLVIAGREE